MSMRFSVIGSRLTAWSTPVPEASSRLRPLFMMRMCSPPWPRMMGRLAFGPKYVEETPGSLDSVSPSVRCPCTCRSCPLSTSVGVASSDSERGSGAAVTVTSSYRAPGAALFSTSLVFCSTGPPGAAWPSVTCARVVRASSNEHTAHSAMPQCFDVIDPIIPTPMAGGASGGSGGDAITPRLLVAWLDVDDQAPDHAVGSFSGGGVAEDDRGGAPGVGGTIDGADGEPRRSVQQQLRHQDGREDRGGRGLEGREGG